ncbi:hypothetical protein [Nannocystis radixulma]|uniref:Uncharacterized protein n=1 Tax=Nannocystis radixulma TaxID=2995305 RepID=A0ABT5B7A7_9BACT|nr:hypothetical protein [Nannocystis radixulma]MDC0670001.1 hypothetical protein [Nannocystis radixulma]
MLCTSVLGDLRPGGLERALQWFIAPLDGPVVLALLLVVVCGLLGLAWRRQHRSPSA